MTKILEGKKLIIGITGSIAAYKTPLLIRELVKLGADVHAVLSPSAVNFVTPMTLANLTRNKVLHDMFDESSQSGGAWHIELVHSCDLMIIAPCSASTLGKLANGICDNALVTLGVALPKGTPFLIAPAMDYSMYMNPSTQRNITRLADDGAVIIPPEEGELSSGLTGPGRLPDTNVLLDEILKALNIKPLQNINLQKKEKKTNITETSGFTLSDAVYKDKWVAEFELDKLKKSMGLSAPGLAGKKVLITAGPTVEKIDDVRFISNFSTGKMGFALAESARILGAEVHLVAGPVSLMSSKEIKRYDVVTAEEMFAKTSELFSDSDIAILSAAVADFTPTKPFDGKLKKDKIGDNYTIELKKTKDILAEVAKIKKENQIVVGFALESSNEIENGWAKMKEKKCDVLVVNSSSKPDSGFGGDKNTITVLTAKGSQIPYPPLSKAECAFNIFKAIAEL